MTASGIIDARSVDITPAIQARRRCVPAATFGYVVTGWLGILPFVLITGMLGGTFRLSIGLILLGLVSASVAGVVAVASWKAERGSRVGAILQNVFIIAFMTALLYAVHRASSDGGGLMPMLAIGTVAIGGTSVALSGAFAAFRYQRLIPDSGALPRTPVMRQLQAAALMLTRNGLLAILHFVGAGVFFCLPAAIGWTVLQRGLSNSSVSPGWKSFVAFFVLLIVCLEIAKRLVAKGKRLRQIHAADARRLDTRRPILLLRSFRDDLTPIERRVDVRNWRSGRAGDLPITLEETLERALRAHGPVIAIGRPGEALPPAGAAREYVTNDDWLARVVELAAESQRIVVIVGKSEGLSLEYASLARAEAWSKVVLILPPLERSELLARWAVLAQFDSRIRSNAPAVDLPSAALAAVAPDGELRFVTCQWRDDECYELAVRWIMATR
jgi:hypothetical protein